MIHCETDNRVLAVIVRSTGATLDDVVRQCPDLTWNQIFLAIGRLSRNGEIQVIVKSPGVYAFRLSEPVGDRHMPTELAKRYTEARCGKSVFMGGEDKESSRRGAGGYIEEISVAELTR